MDLFGAASFLLALGRAIYDYGWAAPAAAEERRRQHEEILNAIQTSEAVLLDSALELNITELRGASDGFFAVYDSYDADPADTVEEGRLQWLIDESALVIGRLTSQVALLPAVGAEGDPQELAANLTLSIESAALVIPLTYLRIQTMIEREHTYSAKEVDDAQRYAGTIASRLAPMLPNLRRRSDRRFGELRVYRDPEPGVDLSFYAYKFDNQRVLCFSTRLPDARRRSEEQRRSRMVAEFLRYRGGAAPVLSEAIANLERIRDARRTKPGPGHPRGHLEQIDHGGILTRSRD